MRAPVAIAIFACGLASSLAGAGVARAADLAIDSPAHFGTGRPSFGYRAGQVVVYDFEPGVVVRSYWRAPWRHRHYFPSSSERPELGRDEDLSAPSDYPEPARTFRRYWSTSAAFLPETPAPMPPLPDLPLK